MSPETFCRIWTLSANFNEVLQRISEYRGKPVPADQVLARAKNYRRQGVRLKKFKQDTFLDLTRLHLISIPS